MAKLTSKRRIFLLTSKLRIWQLVPALPDQTKAVTYNLITKCRKNFGVVLHRKRSLDLLPPATFLLYLFIKRS